MKKYSFFPVYTTCALVLFVAACSNSGKNKLPGNWKSADGQTILKITDKQFAIDNDSPVPEDYFLKGDTIYTSFEGNQPYTKFVVQRLDEHQLKLLYPDSTAMEFSR